MAVFLNAIASTFLTSGLSLRNILLLMAKYYIFSGRISLTKSDTKWPLSPCPSHTPNSDKLLIMNDGKAIMASWFILGLF